jgi:folate-binding protein YgfZ
MIKATILSDRSILKISGPEAKSFLQGLLTNNMDALSDGHPLYSALLTPQGKILCDLLLSQANDQLFIDCAASQAADLAARLRKYRLRAKVVIEEAGDKVTVLASASAPPAGLTTLGAITDPRYAGLGQRWLADSQELTESLPSHGIELEPREHYERHRIECGVPDSTRDLEPDAFFPLDCNVEELHGVDFTKGCYVGQELTSRMKHRATSRRRILPVTAGEALPPVGTKILIGDTDIGEMRGSLGPMGLALIRLDRLGNADTAMAGTQSIRIGRPPYPLITSQDPS